MMDADLGPSPMGETPVEAGLRRQIERLRARLEETEDILRAIRYGEVDALVIDGPAGQQVFTLKSAETPYRILVEQMHEGAVTLTANGVILYANRRFAEMIGLPHETVVGRLFQSVVAPADREAFAALMAEGAHGAGKAEFVLETAGGGTVPVYLSINPLTIEGVRSLCLVVTDLTEQKRNEEVVAAERLARSILEHATEAIVVCDAARRITHASHAVRRLCDGNPIGQSIAAALPLSMPRAGNGEEVGAGLDGCIAAALAGRTVQGVEADLHRTPGKDCRLLVSAGPLYSAQHRIIGCVVTLTDISDRLRAEAALRQSEERLQFALEAARVVAWEWTPDTDRTWHSANAGTVMGLARSEVQGAVAAIGGPVPAEDQASVRAALAEAVHGKPEFEYEYRVAMEDGAMRWMVDRGRVLRDEAGAAVRLAGVSIDITERKRAEDHLKLLAAELSHRVKNSLAIVQSVALQTLHRTDSLESFRVSFNGRLQALALGHSLLTQTGWQSADLRSLVERCLQPYRAAQGQGLRIGGPDVALPPRAGLALCLVLHELASNAAKYGALSAAAGTLEVAWHLAETESGKALRLRWAETGGPKVERPKRKGFGTDLIQRSITYELDGRVTLEFREQGVCCDIVIPWTDSPVQVPLILSRAS